MTRASGDGIGVAFAGRGLGNSRISFPSGASQSLATGLRSWDGDTVQRYFPSHVKAIPPSIKICGSRNLPVFFPVRASRNSTPPVFDAEATNVASRFMQHFESTG